MVTIVNTDIFSVVWKSQREFTKNNTICDSSHTHFATQNKSLKLSCLLVNGFYMGMRFMVYSRHFLIVPRLFEEKRRDIVFGIPSFRPSVRPSVLPSP